MREFCTIYSNPSVEALKKLITTFLDVFGICLDPDDMFYYGVFCHVTTYANFKGWEEAKKELDFIPGIFLEDCATSDDRIEYVEDIINQVMTGEIEKPEWMYYVEENSACDWCEQMPSTFLRLIPKDEKYRELGCRFITFLYSPNRLSSIVSC